MALTDVRQYFRPKLPFPFTGQNMRQSKLGDDRDVPRRSPEQAPRCPASSLRLHPRGRWLSPAYNRPSGIAVPSAFAAAKAEQGKLMQPGLRLGGPGMRPVLFDYLLYVPLSMLVFIST